MHGRGNSGNWTLHENCGCDKLLYIYMTASKYETFSDSVEMTGLQSLPEELCLSETINAHNDTNAHFKTNRKWKKNMYSQLKALRQQHDEIK